MKEIKLGKKNTFTLIVDDQDYNLVSELKWYTHKNKHGYIRVTADKIVEGKVKKVYIGRFLMQAPKEMLVDHVNGNTLDNRRSNLRIVTRAQNCFNRASKKVRKYGIKFKGVFREKKSCPLKKPWLARIQHQNNQYHLGMFATQEEAAQAYDRKATELFGEYARLNFPTPAGR